MVLDISPKSRRLLTLHFGLHKIDQNSFLRRQADIILCLLSANYLGDVEILMGQKITHLPPDPALNPVPFPKLPAKQKLPFVRVLRPNPPVVRYRKERWALVKDGATLNKLFMLGVKKRDINSWTRRKYIKVMR